MKLLPYVIGQVVLLGVTSPQGNAQLYSLADLGDLPGGPDDSRASGLNDLGEVVGTSRFADGFAFTSRAGFLWSDDSLMSLGDFPGSNNFWVANDVNNSGVVVGESQSNTTSFRPLRWDRGADEVAALPELAGSGFTEVNAVNESGVIVGASRASPAVWDDNGVRALPTLAGFPEGSVSDVNDLGVAVGQVQNASGFRAVLWDTVAGGIVDLGGLPGGIGLSQAWAINNAGQVVGFSYDADGGRAFIWHEGVMRDIGRFDPRSINEAGFVVGVGSDDTGLAGVLWDETRGAQYLNDLVDASAAGWRLEYAFAINAAAQIAGYGRDPHGNLRAFLLTPVPEPSALCLFVTSVCCVRLARRHSANRPSIGQRTRSDGGPPIRS